MTTETILETLEPNSIEARLSEKLQDLKHEPEFSWSRQRATFTVDEAGTPAPRVAVANCDLDFDLWRGLRNPAQVGLHPVGLKQLWEFYALNSTTNTDESGRPTIFRIPESFEEAKQRYNRAVLISAMLPISPELMDEYRPMIRSKSPAPLDTYLRSVNEVTTMLNRALPRLAHELMRDDRVVVVMNDANVAAVTEQTVPSSHRGNAHGVCKNGNYSQKSVAALTGLGQFGIHRLIIRDEFVNGRVERFLGPMRSIVVFDRKEPVNGEHGVQLLTAEWHDWLHNLYDFTQSTPELNEYRFCSHFGNDGESTCSRCIEYCPSGALANSSPTADGTYPSELARQEHRFWEGKLQFDYRSCLERRSQLSDLYGDWICGRCLAICATEGVRNPTAAAQFPPKRELNQIGG